MNKKLLYPAIVSIAIQFLYVVLFLMGQTSIFLSMSVLFMIFYVITIPYVIIWFIETFRQYNRKYKILNSLCVLATLPLFFIALFITIALFPVQHQPKEIDMEQIHMYDVDGNEIPPSNLFQKVVKDSVHISRIHLDEK